MKLKKLLLLALVVCSNLCAHTITFSEQPTKEVQQFMDDEFDKDSLAKANLDGDEQYYTFVVRDATNNIIGAIYGCRYWNNLFVLRMMVVKEHRRKGMGTQLLYRAMQWSKEHGCRYVYADGFSFETSIFTKNNFELEYTRKGYDKNLSVNCLRYSLTEPLPTINETYSISKIDDDNNKILEFFFANNKQFYQEQIGDDGNELLFCFTARDDDNNLIGAVKGYTCWGSLYITYLVVRETLRGKGYGSELIEKAFAWGKEKKCTFAFIDTLDFQAMDFYRYKGFYIEFTRTGYYNNHKVHYIRKDF